MIVADTNVVLRVLVRDDEKQEAQVLDVIAREGVLVLDSVLLEARWVMEGFYGMSREKIAAGLVALLTSAEVEAESPYMVKAIQWYGAGMDFGDAVILAGANRHGADTLVTFDKAFIKKAKGKTSCAVRQP
ncbi:twitching motility protein PilT [Isoalcanivorax pacificus W11-5]|uniref:Twitching motility protein PilT n=1 Tax=Isoalcanivorax pacificus W11-5 TaxID=391936 RepID=A0A0B4XIZ6_9GAMM|nr:type II toxin-antitoxin system VapC family toxin [Isoalcanivorax pacificus]AJD48274.1 twitching motility protein PilT [Isoalcanivorax pacificus W11-5]